MPSFECHSLFYLMKRRFVLKPRDFRLSHRGLGQRVNELLSINKDMFKIDKDILVLDFSQNKQGQANRIPALPKLKSMYDNDDVCT